MAPKRRSLLKGIATGAGTLGYSGLVAADESKEATAETLANNERYQDIYATNGRISVEVRWYKRSQRLVFISTPSEPNKLKGTDVTSEGLPLPDPPALVKSWNNREDKVSSDCEVIGLSDHYFAGADIKLTTTGTTVTASIIASILCAITTKHPATAIACGVGSTFFNWLFLQGYGVEGEATLGFMDVDRGQRVYTRQTGWVTVDVPSVAVVGAPYAGASTGELEFYKIVSDLAGFNLPEVPTVHVGPIIKQL